MAGALATARSAIETRILDGFDDRTFGREQWERLLESSGCDIVYLTWEWQRAWWEAFGKGQLLLITGERRGKVVALAPFYCRSGMIYFVGNAHWEADRLDFIGDITQTGTLEAILERARAEASDFQGFKFEFVPENSPASELMRESAARLRLSCYEEWCETTSNLHLADREAALAAINGKKLRKRENFFRRGGTLEIRNLRNGEEIFPRLKEFFNQHIERWQITSRRSSFVNQGHRDFYERISKLAANAGWLRFSHLDWNGQPIAFHYGYCYRGRYYWNAPTFAGHLADRSPGQVMLKQLVLAAIEEDAKTFDFGTGDQEFKLRLASQVESVKGWGLYPTSQYSETPVPCDLSAAGSEVAKVYRQAGQAVDVADLPTLNQTIPTPLKSAVRTRILKGFDDPEFGPDRWNRLLQQGVTDSVFLTWHYQRAWWETFGPGELLLIAAERDGRVVALAPFYAESHMVYFIGTGFEQDCLDFIGDVRDRDVLCALLETARCCVPGFEGFKFYFVPDKSGTAKVLAKAAKQLDLSCYEEGEEAAPWLDMAAKPEVAIQLANKKKLLRYERFFLQNGDLRVRHLCRHEEIEPCLRELFEQHIARWPGPVNPSRFLYVKAQKLLENLTSWMADTGWLRFTRIEWNDRPIALHFGFVYQGRYIWGSPSFEVDLAKHSPGQVLIRQLLLAAIEERANAFDFRTGDAPFKLRFASDINHLHHWGLYER